MKINLVLVAIIFVVLKLTGVVSWPWLWVLCPLWIPFVFFIIVLFAILITVGIAAIAAVIADFFT